MIILVFKYLKDNKLSEKIQPSIWRNKSDCGWMTWKGHERGETAMFVHVTYLEMQQSEPGPKQSDTDALSTRWQTAQRQIK